MWLSAAFVTFLLMAELTGSKLISFLGFTLTLGVIPFPVTFLITDTLNEFYGKKAVKHTTFLGMIMILMLCDLRCQILLIERLRADYQLIQLATLPYFPYQIRNYNF